MKNLLIALFVTCGVLAPVAAQAAPASQLSRSTKKYGGFKPGMTFKLRVTDRDVDRIAGSVPGEIPDFKKGDVIKFTIGKKGQLMGRDGIWIKFDDGSKKGNDYVRYGSNPSKLTSIAYIDKNGAGEPVKGTMRFTITDFSNFFPLKYQVTYKLKK